ncbi:MAG: SCO family protein [Methyloceanibacter sp.]|uniref:SCO family protein n=1 Tax=Methyloceanibacter sp. TaxID=1965321 RepID=UPI003D9B8AC3
MSRRLAVIVAGFLIGALAGAAALVLNKGHETLGVATTGTALVGGPFTLVDQTGKTVTERDFRGRYMLVFFGFTHCPDICPAELQVIAASLEALGPAAKKVVPVFITVDPERDTPEVMADYIKNFGDEFVGLTGSPEQIAAVAKAYRVAYAKFQEKDSVTDYSVDHSALVYLMSPNGDYITHLPYGTSAEKMAETLRRYL